MVLRISVREKGGTCNSQLVALQTLKVGVHEGPNGLEREPSMKMLPGMGPKSSVGSSDKKAELLPDDGVEQENVWPRIFRPAAHHCRMDTSHDSMLDYS
jgi:hypothetical protein